LRVEGDDLGVIQVHRDAGHIAEEPDAPAVGGDVDFFGDVGTVEE
jgi:hypothetical protein